MEVILDAGSQERDLAHPFVTRRGMGEDPSLMTGHHDAELMRISSEMVSLREEIEHIGTSDAKVLISGGASLSPHVVARSIHRQSARSLHPFVRVSCAGVSDAWLTSELFGHVKGSVSGAVTDKSGLLELADEGTVFLDDIAEMPERVQRLLTDFLETGEIQKVGAAGPSRRVNVRIIASTRRNLYERVQEGRFREDLFYRLNSVHIVVPDQAGTA
jgi:two-component system, NtrC family, response regulator AtoC